MKNPDELKADFPVEIDLAVASPAKGAKPTYPTLFIGEAADQLPADGYALVFFRKQEGELEIQNICLPEPDAAEESEGLMDTAKSVAKDMGVDTGEDTPDDIEEE